MKFIDLFAGIGGFHLALSRLGHECVFASEIKPRLRKVYKQNFPDTPIEGDITKIEVEEIPAHDILCGGFPCQPFSFAGKKLGFDDEKGRGNLFLEICRVLEYHKPTYIFLENVSALPGHDEGRTWKVIQQKLDELGYDIKSKVISPHEFGIPQHRPRFYIVGKRRDADIICLDRFKFPKISRKSDVHTIVDENDVYGLHVVRPQICEVFDLWQEFVNNTVERDGIMPSFCLKTWEFGADYAFEDVAPAYQPIEKLVGRKGAYGIPLKGETREELISGLPDMAQKKEQRVWPEPKVILTRQNREFYERHKDWIEPWKKKIMKFPRTQQSFEWSTDQGDYDLHHFVIQLRPSGVRIRRTNYVPTITLCTTATPIIPWVRIPIKGTNLTPHDVRWGRYISPKEAARIQSMDMLDLSTLSRTQQFMALGNAVNVHVVEMIARQLLP